MNKISFFLLFLLISCSLKKEDTPNSNRDKDSIIYPQQEELRYFISQYGLLGVKNAKGDIIIPADFDDNKMRGIENNTKVENGLIFLMFNKRIESGEPNSAGFMYDRKGNFLFHPFLFDTGADYFSEGLMRIVKNGKVGFANIDGKIVMEPQHDFAEPFNYGYSQFCDGCHWECASKDDCEHQIVVGGNWGMMDKTGKTISPLLNPTKDDINIQGNYYPNPFHYTEKEQKIVDFFRKQEKELSSLYYEQFTNSKDIKNRKIYIELVETPKEYAPYYEICIYDSDKDNITGHFNFLAQEQDGKIKYFTRYLGNHIMPFTKWKKEKKEELSSISKKLNNE